MPTGLNVIIDLSHHNGSADFAQVKATGIVGVIHKATQGTTFVDPTYRPRQPLALGAGLLWGAYHFGTGEDGASQADHFLATVGTSPQTLLVLDYEANPKGATMTLTGVRAFVDRVFQQTGRYVGLYSNDLIRQALPGAADPLLQHCFLWIAQYRTRSPDRIPRTFGTWTLWQYTDGVAGPGPHAVAGVGACDRSCFNGSTVGLHRLWNAP